NAETQSDTLLVNLSGSTHLDVEVMPYYMFRSHEFRLTGGEVQATFTLEKILTGEEGADIEEVSLYLSKTTFVDNRSCVAHAKQPRQELRNPSGSQREVSVPKMIPSQDNVGARIRVRIQGVEHRLLYVAERIALIYGRMAGPGLSNFSAAMPMI